MERLSEQASVSPRSPDLDQDRARSGASLRKGVLEPAARLCAAARVLVRHRHTLDSVEGDKLLAEIDDAAGVLQDGVSTLARTGLPGGRDAASPRRSGRVA